MALNKKGGGGGGGGGGISVACLPCDDEAEIAIKKKNCGKKMEHDNTNKEHQKKQNNAAHNKNKNKKSVK